ncbi:methylated-DNA--[protein]-cysteine S-methyltransferase [Bradyrhizobium lupini]|uniref:methylated-DNA--[protein]-cysteine S-methyltransferase n=1 Tax=Rhizobium lupini TaxID=136996 RepID=UPI00296FB32F
MVEAPQIGVSLPLDLRGTAFQRRVWLALREIPPGKTVSYEELARRIGSGKRGKAVASACASNPLAVAIPCHRVTRSDGSAFRALPASHVGQSAPVEYAHHALSREDRTQAR